MSSRTQALAVGGRLGALGTLVRQTFSVVAAFVALSLLRRWLSKDARRQFDRTGRRERDNAGARHPRDSPEANRRPNEAATPAEGMASAEEIGPDWHFDGKRRWAWFHDGSVPNGWIEFCSGGVLRTSLSKENGTWERRGEKEMVATFGRCHHSLVLVEGRTPQFKVTQRSRKDGGPMKGQRQPNTRGRLE
mmetsp:Transcript_2312/g.5840  ORF Transcript_2312/g.5840 Transcript_2312/m.5840 type:complete len:191 (+) Transcript_2312:42-614(+)